MEGFVKALEFNKIISTIIFFYDNYGIIFKLYLRQIPLRRYKHLGPLGNYKQLALDIQKRAGMNNQEIVENPLGCSTKRIKLP